MSKKPGWRRGTSWRAKFLAHLAEIPNVSRASMLAGVNVKTAYRHRDVDPRFKAAWEQAFQVGVDQIECSLMRLATKGEEEPIWMKNETGRPVKVDTVRRVNVTAAIFLFKGHRPNVYRERFTLSSPPGESLSVTADPAFAEALARAYGPQPAPAEPAKPA